MNSFIVLGLIFSALLNNLFIGYVVKALWINAGRASERLSRYDLQTSILGGIEGIMYFTVIYTVLVSYSSNNDSINLLLIIGAWLTLKTLSSVWDKKGNRSECEEKNLEDKYWPGERFNIFLIGTSLNILSASITAYSIFLMTIQDNYINSAYLLIAPLFALTIIYKVINSHPGD
ncbi:MAG: hypothetical protein QG639_1089 [Patescibacteria group bacterium]|nr:hypothetical protein [Patescibacteria group bacterium]